MGAHLHLQQKEYCAMNVTTHQLFIKPLNKKLKIKKINLRRCYCYETKTNPSNISSTMEIQYLKISTYSQLVLQFSSSNFQFSC